MNLVNNSTRISTARAKRILNWVSDKIGVVPKIRIDIFDLYSYYTPFVQVINGYPFGMVLQSSGMTLAIGTANDYLKISQTHFQYGFYDIQYSVPKNVDDYLVLLSSHELQHVKDLGQVTIRGKTIVTPLHSSMYEMDFATANKWHKDLERSAYAAAERVQRIYNEEKLAGFSFDIEPKFSPKAPTA